MDRNTFEKYLALQELTSEQKDIITKLNNNCSILLEGETRYESREMLLIMKRSRLDIGKTYQYYDIELHLLNYLISNY